MNGKLGQEHEETTDEGALILASPAIRVVLSQLVESLDSGEDVLLRGPSGAGKTSLAHHAHGLSRRKAGPFVSASLAEISDSLASSELSGHVKNAFSGAETDRQGLLRAAHRGTIIVDEIDKGSLALQGMFLRFLDDRKVRPVGADKAVPVDVGFIAATNRDLEKEVEGRRFLADLLFRLSETVIDVPPLSERRDDIAPLINYYARVYAAARGREAPLFGAEAVSLFEGAAWPGNVRDLKRAVLYCVKFAHEGSVSVDIARSAPGISSPGQISRNFERLKSLGELPSPEKRTRSVILEALEITRWNYKQAADALGIPLRTFLRDRKRYAIDP
ncbi:MAG TPA: sigma 54-interacting transcriptional regulator [Planctomycetota bacterium]|nr:sigma 54-interacting transcriptional regulator [Planctomycetota bacterium]